MTLADAFAREALRTGGAPLDARDAFEAAVASDPSALVGLAATLLDAGAAERARDFDALLDAPTTRW
jgi:hypothetical protein